LTRKTTLEQKAPLRRTTALGRRPLARSVLHAESVARRAQPKRRPAQPIPAEVRVALAVRSEGKCEIATVGCTAVATDFAHRKKVGAGGRKGSAARAHHVLSNALAACRSCHSTCHANPAEAYANGWMLREHHDATHEPVLYRGAWRLLGDDGSTIPTTTPEEAM
jgi:5-methylcytosine-specific restriction enzyme A